MANQQKTALEQGPESNRRFSTFYVGDLFLGVEVRKVQEVLRYQEITRVPLAPSVIEGLINVRGQIVTAIDMRRTLKIEPRPAGQTPMNMVIRSDDGVVSLLVDEIGEVVEPPPNSYEPAPETMRPEQRELIDGVYKLEGALLLILNTGRVLRVRASG